MKEKIIIILILILPSIGYCIPFQISGCFKEKPTNAAKLFMYRVDAPTNYGTLVDSTQISDKGRFKFKISNDLIGTLYKLSFQSDANKNISFPANVAYFIVNGEKKVEFMFGSENELYLTNYRSSLNEYNILERLQRLQAKYFQIIDQLKNKKKSEITAEDFSQMQKFQIDFSTEAKDQVIKSENEYGKIISLFFYFISGNNSSISYDDSIKRVVMGRLPETILANALLKMLYKGNIPLRLDSIFVNHSFTDANKIRFSKIILEKKITVLDFTASWCPPCRRSNTEEIPQFLNRIKGDTNIAFISISIDTDVDQWKKAIAKDKIYWKYYWMEQKNGIILPAFLEGNGIPYYLIVQNNNIISRAVSLKEVEFFLKNFTTNN